jgi:hypothetical protein
MLGALQCHPRSFDPTYLRETVEKHCGFGRYGREQEGFDFLLVPVQTRLGVFESLSVLLTHPEAIRDRHERLIECRMDQYFRYRWAAPDIPCLHIRNGKIELRSDLDNETW